MLGFSDDYDAGRNARRVNEARGACFSTKMAAGGRLQNAMSLLFSFKAMRLLLAVSVSVWMAGGCLFGCSNSAMASETADNSAHTVVAAESCHATQSHDCCAKQKPTRGISIKLKQPNGLLALFASPRGMMNDCPLLANGRAITSKTSSNLPAPERAPVVFLPRIENSSEQTELRPAAPFPPNRGPTYLRCCVFLI